MINIFNPPQAKNEAVKQYRPGSPERRELKAVLEEMKAKQTEIPMYIGGKEVTSEQLIPIKAPHDHQHILGHYHKGTEEHVQMAIDAALSAREKWAAMSWEHRASIFLKAASLIAGPYRQKMNAATMLGQSKNVFQAEIDAACESVDFLNFNVDYLADLYSQQPENGEFMWNRLEQRPLEGFVFALSPFNFTSISLNLAAAPAMMGNVVVWKPSNNQIYSAHLIMEIYKEAGLPDGVINLVYASGPVTGKVVFSHPDFAGIHYTGSTEVFQNIWKQIGNNISKYKTYPRIVGETGGKDFILAHPSAKPIQVATAISRGAFEYQGQKCSAASRAYIPENIWEDVKTQLFEDIDDITMGSPEDFTHFMNAVIDESSFDKLASYIDQAKRDEKTEVIKGGNYDKSKGYFIEPTIILTKDPHYVTMEEELFGPVMTIYLYNPDEFDQVLDLVDQTSPYGLTGAIFSQDRYAIDQASKKLIHAAGNFYINDKPTGAVVGNQPFGGSRASGTNDKAGSMQNLMRWVSPRTIKETFLPAEDHRYPFLKKDRCH